MSAHLTDAQVDAAIKTLRLAIEGAENSNQSGEEFVVTAAAAGTLLKALVSALGAANELGLSSAFFPRVEIEAALAKAGAA